MRGPSLAGSAAVERPAVSKPSLTLDRLLNAGFDLLGEWELRDSGDLHHRIDLPVRAGVYAFAINGVVQYVGLASKSVRQRLSFYRKPGVSQRTNIRLNEIIKGHLGEGAAVQVLVAHPSDWEWNGLSIKGPEGLEAGLIADFDLPWNLRGTSSVGIPADDAAAKSAGRQSGRAGRILQLLQEQPGLTAGEIATAIYGRKGSQPQVNTLLHQLMESGAIERRGLGGSDPYRYFSKD